MQHKIIIIPIAERESANIFCNEIGANGDTFTVELCGVSTNVATHLVCGWFINDEQLKRVEEYFTHIYDDFDIALENMKLKRMQQNE